MPALDLAQLRVVAITDRTLLGDDPAHAFARALDGVRPGSVAIQVRAKDLDGGALLSLAKLAVATGVPVLVNDRVDVALAAGACGVHLPEAGLLVDDVHRRWPSLAVGVSRHDPADVARALADPHVRLVHVGPLNATPGKTAVGTAVLREIVKPHGARPVAVAVAVLVGVGGIQTADDARAAIAAGCDAVAMIRAAWSGGSLARMVEAIDQQLAIRA